MGYKKRTYKVAEVMTGNPPTQQWRLVENGQILDPTVPIVFNKNTDNMKKVDHYRIRFDIKNFGNSRLRFAPEKDDVLWAAKGASCPQSSCYMPNVLWVDDMDDDGEWIDVINMDMVSEDFWFTLNLVDKSDPTSKNFVALDPGGGNQNGGHSGSGSQLNSLVVLALGVGAGLMTFVGAKLLLGR